MHFSLLSSLILTATAATTVLSQSPPSSLKIDPATPSVTCTRKSTAGDTISVHYRGTLFATGEQFDASYDRGSPLKFQLGAGRVIQGYVCIFFCSCPR